MNKKKKNVLIAGIAGASLGTEILKCLILSDNYDIFGCDISDLAYGQYQFGFNETFLVDRDNYIRDIMELCIERKIQYIIPGGEEPMILIGRNRKSFENEGISYIGNSEKVIEVCSSKAKTFKILSSLGFKVPFTKSISILSDLDDMIFPCIIKPSAGSGGSVTVFLAENQEEAGLYVNYLLRNGKPVIAQDYIPHEEGEFTVGVLSSKNQEIFGSIALKRIASGRFGRSLITIAQHA